MAEKKYNLSDMELHEISLVDRGANQHAKVVLFKRDSETKCPKCGGTCKGKTCDEMEMKKVAPKGIKFNIGFSEEGGSEIQSVVFDSKLWTTEKATAWLKEHEMKSDKVDEQTNTLRFRQKDPDGFKRFRMITPGAQITKALKLKESYNKIQQLVDAEIRNKFQKSDGKDYCWVRDLYTDYAVFEQNGNLFQVTYELKRDPAGVLQVKLGEKEPVEMVYQPVSKKVQVVPAEVQIRLGLLKAQTALANFRSRR